jgi:hypothetical protein
VWLSLGILLVVMYSGVLLLYSTSGASTAIGDPDAAPPADGVQVRLTVRSVEAAVNQLDVDVTIAFGANMVPPDKDAYDRNVVITMTPGARTQQVVFPAGIPAAVVPTPISTEGDISVWPFDRHNTVISVQAAAGPLGSTTPLPATVVINSSVSDWKVVGAQDLTGSPPGSDGTQLFSLSARRSGGTLAVAAILICTLVTLPVLSAFVAAQAYRRRRKVEPAFAGWITAMLFATIPLRNFLPGSPPPGSWVDAAVVLWVMVGLVASLAVYVVAWYRSSASGPNDDLGRGPAQGT